MIEMSQQKNDRNVSAKKTRLQEPYHVALLAMA